MHYNQNRVIRVDESYYNHSTKPQSPIRTQDVAHSELIDAILATKEPPCTKFNCEKIKQCAKEKVDCRLFRHYVNNDNYSSKPEKYIARLLRPYDLVIDYSPKEKYLSDD